MRWPHPAAGKRRGEVVTHGFHGVAEWPLSRLHTIELGDRVAGGETLSSGIGDVTCQSAESRVLFLAARPNLVHAHGLGVQLQQLTMQVETCGDRQEIEEGE